MNEKWIVGMPGGPAPFYSVVSEKGRIIAMQIPDGEIAKEIAKLPELLEKLSKWESGEIFSLNAMMLYEKQKADLAAVMSVLQRYQPAGSPPPGGPSQLAEWIMQTNSAEQAAAREDAERLARALTAYPSDYDLEHKVDDGYMVIFMPYARNEALAQHDKLTKGGDV